MTETFELGYCTNIHPGETLAEVIAAIDGPVAQVSKRFAGGATLGLGLRLGGTAAVELRRTEAREALRDALARANARVFTINGFPFGRFHGTTVKEQVYRPDWTERARIDYTKDLATALAWLVRGDGVSVPSISTVPGAFAPRARDAATVSAIARNLGEVAAVLWKLRESGGTTIALALEPEPCCMLETIDQTVAFFAAYVYSGDALESFAARTGASASQAEAALRTHLGVCLDACHAAVEFEDPRACIDSLLAAGIPIAKIQVSAGLELVPSGDALARVRAFADPVYLHQVVAETTEGLVRYLDLGDALEDGRAAKRWRVHFHVPVFAAELGPCASTQPFLVELLAHARRTGATAQFEVETYTWDVLPAEHRTDAIDVAIARELAWTAAHLR